MSELSLAAYFKQQNLLISFEKVFTRLESNSKKDIDVTVSDTNGNSFHLEVYMPNKNVEAQGFFNPCDDDYHFSYKAGKKLLDKFGTQGIAGLNGEVLLAINSFFFEMHLVKQTIGIDTDYSALIANLPAWVDGILVFRDDFLSRNSLILYNL